MTQILLVEDEPSVFQPLLALLQREHYDVLHAEHAQEARVYIKLSPDLVLLDWMLPDGQGIDLLRSWRLAHISTPVLFLTARSELIDKVLALELGADDFLTKPFEPRELLARIKAILRRTQQNTPSTNPNPSLHFAEIQLCPTTRMVSYQNMPIDLTRMEFDLLHLLMQNPNRVFARDELLNKVWGYDAYPTTRTVDTHILQLRRKTRSSLFVSVRGIGYRLTDS